jgi:transposase
MKTVDDYEAIRRAYYIDNWSIREIGRRMCHGRAVIRKAIARAEPEKYKLSQPRQGRVLEPYKPKILEYLEKSERNPRKQRYTAHKIYQLLQKEGYQGSEGSVHNYVSQQRKKRKQAPVFLPLEFDPGRDAQVDWGEVVAEIGGRRQTVQVFILRLNYSRARFVMVFPFQKQEAFFEGHIQAFRFFGGAPRRIAYDNLKTAVFRILEGHNRQEQAAFKAFRSYYLFESHFCTPAQGHEKGGVESDVGYAQRNFFVPIPQANDFEQLNAHLRQACRDDMQRPVRGQAQTVLELWQSEKTSFLPLGASDYQACSTHMVKVNPYSQVVFETNRYSVPTAYVSRQLALRAYPFRVEILSLERIVATHARCFEREQDILDPLHYLELLEQRPGAFEHALPLRQWRKTWSADYERLLEAMRERRPDGRGVQEFVAVLKLHQSYPGEAVAQAVKQALDLGTTHLDGIRLCLRQILGGEPDPGCMDMAAYPDFAKVGNQPVNLEQYNLLLGTR